VVTLSARENINQLAFLSISDKVLKGFLNKSKVLALNLVDTSNANPNPSPSVSKQEEYFNFYYH
jgi:hypothetical protein